MWLTNRNEEEGLNHQFSFTVSPEALQLHIQYLPFLHLPSSFLTITPLLPRSRSGYSSMTPLSSRLVLLYVPAPTQTPLNHLLHGLILTVDTILLYIFFSSYAHRPLTVKTSDDAATCWSSVCACTGMMSDVCYRHRGHNWWSCKMIKIWKRY